MASPRWRIVGTAPWVLVLGAAGCAFGLFGLALTAQVGAIGILTAVLGIALCGSSAAYSLDEFCVGIADASPTSRVRRVAWRATVAVVPAAVLVTGLAALSLVHPAGHWTRLLPVGAATIAGGMSLAAILRRHGTAKPGDVAGGITLLGTITLVGADPLHRWLPALPLDQHVTRTFVLWTAISVAFVVISILSTHDPGGPPPTSVIRSRPPTPRS